MKTISFIFNHNLLYCLDMKIIVRQHIFCNFRYTRYCSGKNIFINFRALENKQQDKFQADLFQPNEIGGFCKVDKELLSQQSAHKSPLQSW